MVLLVFIAVESMVMEAKVKNVDKEGMDRVKFMDVDRIADVDKIADADKIVDVVKDMEGRLELLSKAREESLVELVVQDWRGVHRKKGS